MSEDPDHWQVMAQGLVKGDASIVSDFCRQYGASLERLAQKHIAPGLQRRVGAESVVQSVCRTFLRRAQGNEFDLTDSGSLWRLLCAITLAKVREKARFHLRQKRNLGQEIHLDSVAGPSLPVRASDPSPAEAAEFTDQFEHFMASLDAEARNIVTLRLQEYTNDEIALKLNCSERTVRRILKQLQERLRDEFESA